MTAYLTTQVLVAFLAGAVGGYAFGFVYALLLAKGYRAGRTP